MARTTRPGVPVNDTAVLLDVLCAYYERFVVLTDTQLACLALWTLHTYTYDVGDTTPYLIVSSAEKRSGKTRLLECLASVCRQPLTAAALTEATLFRIVSGWKPTLLIDETDTIFRDSRSGPSERQEGLRSILNTGYRRGVKVPRIAPNGEPLLFDVYGPKVLAGIGHLPETIEDRGLAIRLKRRLDDEPIERFRFRTGEQAGGVIRKRIEEWKDYARIQLSGVEPDLPPELDDRAQDAYEQLVAIADLAGSQWAARGRDALSAVRNVDSTVRETQGVRLIRDLQPVLEHLAGDYIATVDLLDWLYRDGDEPWQDWWGESTGKRAAMKLSRVLSEYDVRPTQFKVEGEKKRGYKVDEVQALCARYRGERSVQSVLPFADAGLHDNVGRAGLQVGTDPKSAHLQGSTDFLNLFPYAGELFLSSEHNPVSQSHLLPGSLEWLESASIDELREFYKDT